MLMTLEEFNSLEVGDHVEAVKLLPILTKEPVVLQTVKVSEDSKEFVVTYHGMTMGRWVCTVRDGVMQWVL